MFNRILAQKSIPEDTYSIIALGNVWLHTIDEPNGRGDLNEKKAIELYQQVLKIDPRNIWAANGIGAVLAHKGLSHRFTNI